MTRVEEESPLSIGQRIRKIPCQVSSRPREDDRITEVFFCLWENGRFSYQIEWLPQDHCTVEAIGYDSSKVRTAVEHTRLFAFSNQ